MSLLKRIAPLVVAGTLALARPAFSQEIQKKEPPAVIGSAYGEVSYFGGSFSETDREYPAFLNLFAGWNLLHKDEVSEGVLLFPNLRIKLKKDTPENPWNNYAEIALGAEYKKGPLMFGVDGGYLEKFQDFPPEGFFARAWSYYWNQWNFGNLSSSENFPLRPQIISSLDLEATTLTGGLDANARLEGGIVVFEKEDFRALPYLALLANGDTHLDYKWDNYLRSTGGIRLQKGPFFLFAEAGYQKSLNGGNSGPVFYAGASFYAPIKTGEKKRN